jgi:type IV pilus assembly protein PilA
MKKNTKKKGFTLIELIVVIAVLGILSAVAVPRLTGFQEDARIAADKATFDTITRSISIAVANETITADVVYTTDENGIISTESDGAKDLIESGASFKLDANKDKTFTWTVTDGAVTAPTIDAVTGEIAAEADED